ncbi:hypothetical protein AVEN_264780-1 [Araneus ventricosus]|uniref:Uncharacterized protein n=1 Tax=Araneus ventricosus TaxID=182803 RepID=A0A4Y2HR57_ARAVE|nr:hypothetical protein AVEN_264780-1 [Araneus ventricosus]
MLFEDIGYNTGKPLPRHAESYGWEEVYRDSMGWLAADRSDSPTFGDKLYQLWRKFSTILRALDWRRNMGSQRCWNLLDISLREDTPTNANHSHEASRPAGEKTYKESA